LELKAAECFHANLLDNIGQAVIMVDVNKKIIFWNSASEKIFGYTKNQALHQDLEPIIAGTNAKEETETITKWLNSKETVTTEYLAQRKDGSLVPVLINCSPIHDDKGAYLGSAVSATDITEQKILEKDMTVALEYLAANIDKIEELNEKLKVVGSLTRHDVRNKLSSVTSYTYILKKRHYDMEDVVEGLDKMSQAVNDSMKIFELDGADVMFPSLPFKEIFVCHGLIVHADSLLRQLLFNFMDNTRKYGKTTQNVWVYYQGTPSGDLQLIYEDDGMGIPRDYKGQLFRQGFSTGGSTGFGLFLSKKIVQVYGWSIREEGEEGKGTKFVMTIPR